MPLLASQLLTVTDEAIAAANGVANVSYRRLQTLELRGNAVTTELWAQHNLLTAAILEYDPNVIGINLASNNLAALRLATLTKVRWLNVQSNGRLSELQPPASVETCFGAACDFQSLDFLSLCWRLSHLELPDNQITGRVSLARWPELTHVDLSGNRDTAGNHITAIDSAACPKLRRLSAYELPQFVPDISQNPLIETLDLAHNLIPSAEVDRLLILLASFVEARKSYGGEVDLFGNYPPTSASQDARAFLAERKVTVRFTEAS